MSWLARTKKMLKARVTPETETQETETETFTEFEADATVSKSTSRRLSNRRLSMQDTTHILRLKRFFARPRPKEENTKLNAFSLHGYSSLCMIQDGRKACGNKIVCISWLTVCLQILTLMAFASYYFIDKFSVPLTKLSNEWKADCSQVDRCHYFRDSMLLGDREIQTNYVCSAKLSKTLPLWSNAKHCAECPPLGNFDTKLFNTTAHFGLIDGHAAVYLDFWSEIHHPSENKIAVLVQSMHDVNGPYDKSCSVSRATNAFGLAGVDGSDYCVDCFGAECFTSSYAKPEAQNVMLASQCKERYACEAFDFDDGRCNEAFFDAVCNGTAASVGDKPTYPRRFSELPGFGWFRDWPHSFADSCALSADLTRLKSADGQLINVEQHHRLRALCHLYTRCVREHPDVCSLRKRKFRLIARGRGCSQTTESRLRQEVSMLDINTAFWSMGITPVSHMLHFGGVILFPSAVFMFFVVASVMAQVHASATQYLICLEVAHQQHKFNKTHTRCSDKVCLFAARALLLLVREFIIICAFHPTIMSILSVSTSFDIVFCGAIAVIILQVDQHLFSTIMTDTRLHEVSQEFSLVLTRQQCTRLQIELTVVFWCAFLWMSAGYVGTVQATIGTMVEPDSGSMLDIFIMFAVLGFALTADLVTEVWCTCTEMSEGVKISKRQMTVRFVVAATRKLLICMCTLVTAFVMDAIYNVRRSKLQAAKGNVDYDVPYNFPVILFGQIEEKF